MRPLCLSLSCLLAGSSPVALYLGALASERLDNLWPFAAIPCVWLLACGWLLHIAETRGQLVHE